MASKPFYEHSSAHNSPLHCAGISTSPGRSCGTGQQHPKHQVTSALKSHLNLEYFYGGQKCVVRVKQQDYLLGSQIQHVLRKGMGGKKDHRTHDSRN